MSYKKINWLNSGETEAKPINKTNLNHMEEGIDNSYIFKNLFNVGNAKMTSNATLSFDNSNNRILMNGSSMTSTNILLNSLNGDKDKDGIILAPGTYTASIKKVSGSLANNNISFYLRKNNGSNLYDGTPIFTQNIDVGVLDNTIFSSTFTLTVETRLHWIGYFNEELRNFNNLVLEFQIEENDEATEYTPFAGYIVESGNNSDGSWIKYSDGTMICRMTKEGSLTYSTFGTLFQSQMTDVKFPQEFTSAPDCFAQNNGANHIIVGQCDSITTSKIGSIEVWSAIQTTTFTRLKMFAIGRWK